MSATDRSSSIPPIPASDAHWRYYDLAKARHVVDRPPARGEVFIWLVPTEFRFASASNIGSWLSAAARASIRIRRSDGAPSTRAHSGIAEWHGLSLPMPGEIRGVAVLDHSVESVCAFGWERAPRCPDAIIKRPLVWTSRRARNAMR